jgi:hypothetical protein
MTTASLTTTVTCAGELRTGDLLVNPDGFHVGVFDVAYVIEGTDVDTDEECVIVVLGLGGSVVLGYGDIVQIVVG